ncbi:Hypothetical protein PHPALM_3109 [Phytophthora palmivora]|uniref:Uncharacterized protein n=1 Tax=Phytophthora palmivora TaxID=4796 RepID=A0A2P4YNA5_9STRA|nr:Hypothetical protein PHPALM_3109 [Phytophthora palmivora]
MLDICARSGYFGCLLSRATARPALFRIWGDLSALTNRHRVWDGCIRLDSITRMDKASRHYQRAGASYVLGYPEPFLVFQRVEDIVLVEVDLGDRLLQAERRLRDVIKLVFGSDGWHEGMFNTWSQCVHAVGIDWNIPECTVTITQRKIDKTTRVVVKTLGQSLKRLNSVIGVLRHILTFIPIVRPFIQC